MLTIRGSQLDALRQERLPALVEALAMQVRDNLGPLVEDLDAAELMTCVRYSLERAFARGIHWESSVTAFVHFAFILGPHFDADPEVAPLLVAPGPNEAAKALPTTLTFDIQRAAGRRGTVTWRDILSQAGR